jgi:predicted AlkP superfamily phosphohydrolase/phosphomutase
MKTTSYTLLTLILFTAACSDQPVLDTSLSLSDAPYVTIESAHEKSAVNTRKIVILAIDALTWDILNPMISQGELPNFEKMVQVGSYGILDPVDQKLYSPRIWTTVATGKMPEKHGITFFLINPQQAMQSGKTAGSDLRKCLAIWNILSHFQKRVHVSNWMVSWPAEPVLGTIISDYMELNHGVHPTRLSEKIKNDFWNRSKRNLRYERISQRFFPWYSESEKDLNTGERQKINNLKAILYRDDVAFENSIDMLNKESPDLTMIYLRSVDIASHFYWKYSQLQKDDTRLEGLDDEIQRFGHIVPEIYRWADDKVGEIVSLMPTDTTFILLSDHGFKTHFSALRGYNMMAILRDMNCAHFAEEEHKLPVVTDTSDPIDPVRKIYVRDDLMPRYTAATGQTRKQLVQEIVETVLSVKTLDGKQVLFTEPFEKLQLMDSEKQPDLAVRFNDMNLSPDDILLINEQETGIETYIQFLDQSGNHDSEAVIIVSGNGARPEHRLVNATTLDIVPTILSLLDLPIADDMDGQPLFSAFQPDTWNIHPVTRIDTYETKIERHVVKVSEPERPDITEQLQSIGYIQ